MQQPQLSTLQLPLSTVIRLILQFLQQQKLTQTFKTLQQQSKISLNIVDKVHIQTIFLQSNWQELFKQLNYMSLSEDLLFDLYEYVVDDLIDKDRYQAAKFIIKRCIVEGNLVENKERLLRMQYICENTGQKAMYHKPPSQPRRQTIVNRILRQTHQEVEKSRLLSLITSALKQQSAKGLITPNLSYSLLEGKHKNIQNQSQKLISKVDKMLRYTAQSRVTSLAVSNKGEYIALGGIDGLIQIYEPIDYTLDTNTLKYQAQGIMLFHQNSINHMVFNQTDEMLLSADEGNQIKVWNMQNGRLLRKIQNQGSIGCINWGIDSSQILIGYQNVQLWGIRGCNLLKQYVCDSGNSSNQQYLLDIFVISNAVQGNKLYIFSQLGTVRVFNYKTQQQMNLLRINSSTQNHGQIIKVLHKAPASSSSNPLFHIATSKYLITINQSLEQIHKYEFTGSGDSLQLVNICISNFYTYQCVKKQRLGQGRLGKDKQRDQFVLQVRERKSGRIVQTKELEAELTIMQMHPWRNLLIGYSINQTLAFWRP